MVRQAYCRQLPVLWGLRVRPSWRTPFTRRTAALPSPPVAEKIDDGTDGPTDQALRDLLDAEHHRQLVDARRRRQAERHQADETVSLAEVLGALAAHEAVVTLETETGSLPPSTICEVGRDYIALRSATTGVRLVPMRQIAAARRLDQRPSGRGGASRIGGDAADLSLHLAERLRELALRRTRVAIQAGAPTLTGLVRRAGTDVAVLELDDGTDAFVALDAVREVRVDP